MILICHQRNFHGHLLASSYFRHILSKAFLPLCNSGTALIYNAHIGRYWVLIRACWIGKQIASRSLIAMNWTNEYTNHTENSCVCFDKACFTAVQSSPSDSNQFITIILDSFRYSWLMECPFVYAVLKSKSESNSLS